MSAEYMGGDVVPAYLVGGGSGGDWTDSGHHRDIGDCVRHHYSIYECYMHQRGS